ncbi:Enhancer of Polycomb [Carabus blaptoides fortunei]
MSKLSFRARALDASKPMPVYMAEELPDLPEYSAINRAVPQMPSGMEKEEECEHHLQRAICAGLIIPTPEVSEANVDAYDKLYPPNYKQPRQLIHMQPFAMEQDIPDYDMDTEDERWLVSQAKKLDLTPLKFEEMMDRLEKSSGQTVVTLNEAKALLKEDDDLIIAVFDYWLNKRLKTQHPLILSVKTEHRTGSAANNPYLAFRRRTEKMQTRKNRKNDETSYEKMLKLRRDLSRAVTLLELVKRREKTKREYLHLTIEIYEKRYQAHDFTGTMLAEVSALKASRPAFTQIFQNHYGSTQAWMGKAVAKDEAVPRKEKRQYKKRKHKNSSARLSTLPGSGIDGLVSSDEEEPLPVVHSPEPEETDEEGQFAFRRNKLCTYHMPIANGLGNWPWCPPQENGLADRRYRYTLTSLAHPRRCVGFARRRLGRGGRVILDRAATDYDDIWRQLDFSVIDAAPAAARIHQLQQHQVLQPASDSSIVISETNGLGATVKDNSDGVKCEIKCEPTDEQRTDGVVSDIVSERDDMLEFLREIKRDWLHFRPKTPPSTSTEQQDELEPVLHLTNTTPITVELQTMSSTCPSTLLDDSLFTTSSFTLQDLYSDTVPDAVSFDDTRQTPAVDSALDRTFGCSRFRVCDSAVTPSVPLRVTSVVVDVPTTPPLASKKQSILSSPPSCTCITTLVMGHCRIQN